MTVRFSHRLVAELHQAFWQSWQDGDFLTEAAAAAGTHRHRGLAWLRESGGVRPRRGRHLQGRYLGFAEREEIALGRAAGKTIRAIAAELGRSPSTISREVTRNSDPGGAYRASTAPVPPTPAPAPTSGPAVPSQRNWPRTPPCACGCSKT